MLQRLRQQRTFWVAAVCLLAGCLLGPARPTAQAQGWTGLATSNYSGTNGMYWNPASLADSRYKFYVSLGGADANFYNDYLTVKAPYTPWQVLRNTVAPEYRDNRGNVVFKSDYLQEQGLNGRPKLATASAEVRLPSFMVSLGARHSLAFGSRVRGFVQATNVSEPVARLARFGLDETRTRELSLKVLNDNAFNVGINAFQEISVSYALAFDPNETHVFKGAITGKYLVGLASAYITNQGVDYQVYKGDSIQLRSRDLGYGYTDYRYYDRPDFKVGDLFGSKRLGRGAGFDVGLSYEWRPQCADYDFKMDGQDCTDHSQNKYRLKLGLAMVDVGLIQYSNPDYVRQSGINGTNSVQWGQLDTIKYRSLDGLDNLVQRVVILNARGRTFTSTLPTAVHFTADYLVRKHLYAGLAWTQNIVPLHTLGARTVSSLALLPRFEHKLAEVAVPLMWTNNYRTLQVGAMVRVGPLTVGSDNLGGIFGATTLTGYDLYASLGWGLHKKRPKDRDRDGVSDKLDLCPTVKGTWEFRGCPDRDGDHVQDKVDACPDEPGLPRFSGCPDRDKDGIADKDDACPDEPGRKDLAGCPDRDADGIADKDDKCPDLPGPKELAGCPDTDHDTLIDPDDDCPTEAGPVENKGCPYRDQDGDGLLDKDDKCPTVAGPADNQGCPWPDTDQDGVLDKDDLCPNTPGPASNRGCPVLKVAEQKVIARAFANLQFQTGKDVIRASSYPSLNALAGLLKDHPEFKLRLSGHTDNVGKPAANLLLSEKRAKAVLRYLEAHGAPAGRIVAEWFGQQKPVATNKTAIGRTKNRRVEMKVGFE